MFQATLAYDVLLCTVHPTHDCQLLLLLLLLLLRWP
jgi:hypothetical protein